MEQIDYLKLLGDCISLAKKEIGAGFDSLKPYAETEFRKFAENAEFLAKLKLTGQIDDVA